MIEVFKGKVAAIMTASPGAFGGLRCLTHLRGVLTIMLVNVLPSEIAVAKVGSMFEGDSEEMTDEKMKGILARTRRIARGHDEKNARRVRSRRRSGTIIYLTDG